MSEVLEPPSQLSPDDPDARGTSVSSQARHLDEVIDRASRVDVAGSSGVGHARPAPAPIELSIIMPCLNEAATVAVCVAKARGFLDRAGIVGEVIVADNGSQDGSIRLAAAAGARVVPVTERGYGAALGGGIRAARGRFIVMGDADDSYDFTDLDGFVAALRDGADLVMGNRFAGGIRPGAMPALHRYLGNPVLSLVGRVLFRSPVRDFHCGLRGFRRDAIAALDLSATGMEFASEMVVKATLGGLDVREVPTVLSPDGRDRPPHLRSWRDGWRHLRFLLMMSPRWLMLYPGVALLGIGCVIQALIAAGPLKVGGIGFDIHTMLYGAAAAVLGLQLLLFSAIARAIGLANGLLPSTRQSDRLMQGFSLERGLVCGLVLAGCGLLMTLRSLQVWTMADWSALDPGTVMRLAIPAVGLVLAGGEIIFASFVLSLINASGVRR